MSVTMPKSAVSSASALPERYLRWHLYGAGLENVGKDGGPEWVPLPAPEPDEILVRHDACGICYSDIKIITLGGEHPRLSGRDLQTNPVVMGHEVALTVVGVGENRRDAFAVGQRFIIQADVFYKGVGLAYGYALTGGMSQYGIIGPEVIDGDEGNYLIPLAETTGDAEAALVEPWACVEAAYHWTHHREWSADQPGLLINSKSNAQFSLPPGVEYWNGAGDVPEPENAPGYVTLVFYGTPTARIFEETCALLSKNGVVDLRFDVSLDRPVNVDVGRIHYYGHAYVGPKKNERSELKSGGAAWFIGAAGPMGMMHVQRALALPEPPRRLICTDRHDLRLETLRDRFAALAEQRGVEFSLYNVRTGPQPDFAEIAPDGFDDIVVLVPSVEAIEQSFPLLAQDGVLNIFAGVARGTMATLDMGDVTKKNVRIVGTTGSSIADMREVLGKLESGVLATGDSLAAIGGLNAFRDGLQAVKDSRFPGKTMIFPQIADLPLTALPDLKDALPAVYARLRDGRFWTNEAEKELLDKYAIKR